MNKNLDQYIEFRHAVYQASKSGTVNDTWKLLFSSNDWVDHAVEYDLEWGNGDYLNGAVRAKLPGEVGSIIRSRTPAPNNRRILMVKTDFGNVVVFERYTPDDDNLKGPLVINMPDEVRISEMIGGEGALTLKQLHSIFGFDGYSNNVGVRLHRFVEDIKLGGRKTKEEKFQRLEAMMVVSTNYMGITKTIRSSSSREQAIERLMEIPLETPGLVLDIHAKHSIPARVDERGVVGHLYRLRKAQAETILDAPYSALCDQGHALVAKYCEFAASLQPDSHRIAESIEHQRCTD